MSYSRPDVYVERATSGKKPSTATSNVTSRGAVIGLTLRGVVGKAILVNSWTQFCNTFAKGLQTPYIRGQYLAESVYGFFQNEGKELVVVRTPVKDMAKATVTITQGEEELIISALDEGDWANNKLSVAITKVPTTTLTTKTGDTLSTPKADLGADCTFTVQVKYNGAIVEQFAGLSNNPDDAKFYGAIINTTSEFITIAEDQKLFATETDAVLTGGAYDVSKVTNADYIGCLPYLDSIYIINNIAIPGITEAEVQSALLTYATNRGMGACAVLDAPLQVGNTNKDALITLANDLEGKGAMYHPWGIIKDPLSVNGATKYCPPSGFILGTMARIDANRGVYKDPAGVDALLKGFIGLACESTKTDLDALNINSVNVIQNKQDIGIVIWGARNLAKDEDKLYVSDIRYDSYINQKLYDSTQYITFEPVDDKLLSKMETTLTSILNDEWLNGALKGSKSDEAYYVKCDTELNDLNNDNGQVVAEIGYAKKKPAEFVVIKIIQNIQ